MQGVCSSLSLDVTIQQGFVKQDYVFGMYNASDFLSEAYLDNISPYPSLMIRGQGNKLPGNGNHMDPYEQW